VDNLQRNGAVDAAKAIAIFGVLLIHASAVGGYAGTVGSAGWDGGLFWGTVLRCAVPVFFLCSGALLLPAEKTVTIRRVWTHYLPHILLALLFWSAAYQAWDLFLLWHRTGVLEAAALRGAVRDFLLLRHKPHLYYLDIMLLIYALLPVTRVFTARASRREAEYALTLWAVLGVCLPILRQFPPVSQIGGIPAQWPLSLTYASVGYTVLGWYLSRWGGQRRSRFYLLMFLCGWALTFAGTLWQSAGRGKLFEGFLYGMAPGVCMEAAGVFGFCLSRWRQRPVRPWAAAVSRGSFCVYLTHMFFLDCLRNHGLTAGHLPSLLSVPLVALTLFICGMAVWLVLRKVPVVSRWLI